MVPGHLKDLRRRFLGSRRAYESPEGALRIDVPVARNPRFVVTAAVFGGPWLAATFVASIAFLVVAPIDPFLIRALALFVALVLTVFMHLLAAMSVWGAFYQASGTETLIVEPKHVKVLRTGLGITLTAKVARLGLGKVIVLPPWSKKAPQPKIEVKTSGGAVRFGAGVSHAEATVIAERIREYFSAEEKLAR